MQVHLLFLSWCLVGCNIITSKSHKDIVYRKIRNIAMFSSVWDSVFFAINFDNLVTEVGENVNYPRHLRLGSMVASAMWLDIAVCHHVTLWSTARDLHTDQQKWLNLAAEWITTDTSFNPVAVGPLHATCVELSVCRHNVKHGWTIIPWYNWA